MKLPWGSEEEDQIEKADVTQDVNTKEEQKLLHEIITNQQDAESVRGTSYDDNDIIISSGIDQIWEDEYKMFIGDQWTTSFAYRSTKARKIRPNSVDNFVLATVMNISDNITVNTPEVVIEGREETDEPIAEKLTYLSKFNDGIHRNNFKRIWKKMVHQFIAYGPIIAGVLWDDAWIGGTGPNRWVGDVRIVPIDRRYIYFDPAIIDLEDRLQECGFIHRKFRKKLSYIRDKWPENGRYVASDINDMELQDEGMDPKQVWLIEAWQKGRPKMMPEGYKKKFLAKAEEALANGDYYKAEDYKAMAQGKLKGVHMAYVANNVFLEYIPYVYDDGDYPFVYKTLYFDENTQNGFGEIRNIKIPQVMHNKADEIEVEAMSRQGLGGMYYQSGAVSASQKESIMQNMGKGGVWQDVDNINNLREREPVKVPASIQNYKERKQRMIETISQNTPIQQGLSPGANIPYRAIAELGDRTDVRTKAKVEILEDFLIELNRMRINRFVQFYTEDRYYRLKGEDGQIIEGMFNNSMAFQEWEREDGRMERFVPEFDITVKIMDEKPQDRNYYTNTAFELMKLNAMTVDHLWYTLDEGRFPPKDQILEDLKARDMVLQAVEAVQQMAPEQQQATMAQVMQVIQGAGVEEFLNGLPDNVLALIQQMPEEEQTAHVEAMMQLPPDELSVHINQMGGGEAVERQE